MTEKVLNIIRKPSKRIYCLFDGLLIEKFPLSRIKKLVTQLEEIGSIRKNLVFFSKQLKPEEHESYIKNGFSPVIVTSAIDIHLTLECLDILNKFQTDILCIGIVNDDLIPSVINFKSKTEVLIVAPKKEDAQNYTPYLDYLIVLDE